MRSPNWRNGAAPNAGAVTFFDAATPPAGQSVSAANSVVGQAAGDFVGGSGWFDPLFTRANAPVGDVLNWTRPFDVVLLALAAPRPLTRMVQPAAWRQAPERRP